jgi:hypothetical protein
MGSLLPVAWLLLEVDAATVLFPVAVACRLASLLAAAVFRRSFDLRKTIRDRLGVTGRPAIGVLSRRGLLA